MATMRLSDFLGGVTAGVPGTTIPGKLREGDYLSYNVADSDIKCFDDPQQYYYAVDPNTHIVSSNGAYFYRANDCTMGYWVDPSNGSMYLIDKANKRTVVRQIAPAPKQQANSSNSLFQGTGIGGTTNTGGSGITNPGTPDVIKKTTTPVDNAPCPCHTEDVNVTYYLSTQQTPGSVPVRGTGQKVVCDTPPPVSSPKIPCEELNTALQNLGSNQTQGKALSGLFKKSNSKFYTEFA